MVEGAANGIGRTLEPVLPGLGLLGCEDFDEPFGELIEPVRLHDVTVKACRKELRENEDALDPRIDAVR
jgi:hypothetical protein